MKITPLLLTGLLLVAGGALFANPQYVNYQGVLNDADGDPLPTGDYTMEFQIHRNLLADSLIWGPFLYDGTNGPGHSAMVHVTNGRFNVILGPADTAGRAIRTAFVEDPATPDQCFVEIRVNGGDPILPRQQILTVPYAFEAQNARALNHVAPIQYFNPPGMMTPFAGPATNVPDGWLVCDGSELLAADYPALYTAIGMAWGGREEIISSEEVRTYFRVPDMRGMFLRGVNGARSDDFTDPDRDARVASAPDGNAGNLVGSLQPGRLSQHRHIWGKTDATTNDWYRNLESWFAGGTEDDDPQVVVDCADAGNAGGVADDQGAKILPVDTLLYTKIGEPLEVNKETRPNNAAVHFIIKH